MQAGIFNDLLWVSADFVLQVGPMKRENEVSIYRLEGSDRTESEHSAGAPGDRRSKALTGQPRPFPRLRAFFSPF